MYFGTLVKQAHDDQDQDQETWKRDQSAVDMATFERVSIWRKFVGFCRTLARKIA